VSVAFGGGEFGKPISQLGSVVGDGRGQQFVNLRQALARRTEMTAQFGYHLTDLAGYKSMLGGGNRAAQFIQGNARIVQVSAKILELLTTGIDEPLCSVAGRGLVKAESSDIGGTPCVRLPGDPIAVLICKSAANSALQRLLASRPVSNGSLVLWFSNSDELKKFARGNEISSLH
jgi:hypothetical protein